MFGLLLGIPPDMGWCHYYDHVDHESPDLVTTSLQDAMNSWPGMSRKGDVTSGFLKTWKLDTQSWTKTWFISFKCELWKHFHILKTSWYHTCFIFHNMFFPDRCFNPITSDFGRLKIYGDGPRWGPVWGDFETGFWASDFRWHVFHWNYGNPKIHTKIHTISASWSMFPIEMAICGQYFQTNPHVHRFPQPQARTCEKPDPELRHDQVMDKELPMRESWNLKRSHWMAVWYMKWYRYVYTYIYI